MSEILAAPTSKDTRARVVVGWLGRGSLVAVLGAAVLLVTGEFHTGRWWAAFAIEAGGVVLALGCLVHCQLNEHERGRAFATTALIIGLVVTGIAWWGDVRSL